MSRRDRATPCDFMTSLAVQTIEFGVLLSSALASKVIHSVVSVCVFPLYLLNQPIFGL